MRGILDFYDIVPSSGFDVPSTEAIDRFRAKGLKPSFSWMDVSAEEHKVAFTVAKMMDIDLLADVQKSLDEALANGVVFRDWAETIIPTLQAKGWWGQKLMTDPLTGETVKAQLGSPARLQTIFRTNMQSAYAAGHWDQIEAQAEDAPFLLYDAIDDYRTRAEHKAWDGKVLPVTDKFWKTHTPPCGWNCRCSVIQLDADDLEQLGMKPDKSPKTEFNTWTNPRTGKTEKVAAGVDPGFGQAAADRVARMEQLLDEKITRLPKPQRKAVKKSVDQAMKVLEQEPPTNVFRPAKTVAEAAKWLKASGYAKQVDFGKMDITVVNAINESLAYHMERFPQLKQQFGFIGSSQVRFQKVYEADLERHRQLARERYPDSDADAFAKRWTKKQRTSGEWATAYSGSTISKAYYGDYAYGITFNETKSSAKDLKQFDAGLKRSLETQFHPVGCDTYKSVMDHELGHAIDYLLDLRKDPEVVALWRSWGGDKATLSGYARQNIAEFIAEAWAEYVNNPSPRPIAQQIGDIINARYKARFNA